MLKLKTQNKFKIQFVVWILSFAIIFNFVLCDLNFSRLFAQESKEEEALFIAERALEDGFYDVALGLFERFLKNYPATQRIAKVKLLIGQCYFHQNKFLEALSKFGELQNQPSAVDIQDEVIYWIAELHFKGNDFAKAATYYQKIIDDFPNSPYLVASYYSLGWCLFQEAKYKEALNLFIIVEGKFPEEPILEDTYLKVVECLYNLKDYPGLKEKISHYLKIYSKDKNKLSYLYFYSGEAEYYLNNFQEAINAYSSAYANTADDKIQALSKLGIGWSCLKLKKFEESGVAFSEIRVASLEKKFLDILTLGKAVLCFETNKFVEAKSLYEELLKASPEPLIFIQACLGKADTLYNLGQYKEAIGVYKDSLAKIPNSSPQDLIDKLHYGLSWAYLKEGEFKDAIGEFKKIVRQTEDKIFKVAALCQIGDTYQDSGDYIQAIQTYNSILKDFPDSLYSDYVQYQLGLTLLKSSKYDEAIIGFLSLRKKYPNSKLLDDATYALGLAYFQREDYNSSREIFEKFQEEFKDSNIRSEGIYLLGVSLYNLGKFPEAIEVFKSIIRTYSQDTALIQKAEYEIADCYFQMGNEKEAMARFKNLRSRYPDSVLTPEVIWWLGEYYYRHNDYNLARRYFSSLIQDFPKSNLVASSYYALGSIYVDELQYQKALDSFEKVIELGKSDLAGTAAIAIADLYVKQDKSNLALEKYNDIAENFPNLKHLIYPKIADLYAKINDYQQAINFYLKSMDVVPIRQMADIQFKLAEVLQVQGKLEEASEEYLKVTYLYSENTALVLKAMLRVAQIYEGKENFREALKIYRKIVAMKAEEAKYAQERIDWIKTHVY